MQSEVTGREFISDVLERGRRSTMKSIKTMTSKSPVTLTNEDRAKGYSIASQGDSVMLLKWKKPIARFSASISVEMMRSMVELIRACEEHRRAQTKHRAEG